MMPTVSTADATLAPTPTPTDRPITTTVSDEVIAAYRRNGYTHIPAVLTAAEVKRFRDAAARQYEEQTGLNPNDPMFKQIVQVWQTDAVLRELTFHPGIAGLARQLAGIPLRLWHDQLLIKAPHNGAATEFHQDAPYWPHSDSRHCLSAWVALVDVPVERGCMSFIPGSHRREDIRAVDLSNKTDLFDAAPDLRYQPRVTVPLRAGDCTFHNGYLAHTANPNDTDEFRYAFVNIYIDANTRYNGAGHVCTENLGIEIGAQLPDPQFPPFK